MIAGALGGADGGTLLTGPLSMLQGAAGNVDIGALARQAVGGGVAGAIVNRYRRPDLEVDGWPNDTVNKGRSRRRLLILVCTLVASGTFRPCWSVASSDAIAGRADIGQRAQKRRK